MQHVICAVFDSASGLFGQLQTVPKASVSVRSFSDAVNNPQSGPLYQHPEDFELKQVGFFDDVTGEITAGPHLVTLVRGKDVKNG